jgi:hypothetical protein
LLNIFVLYYFKIGKQLSWPSKWPTGAGKRVNMALHPGVDLPATLFIGPHPAPAMKPGRQAANPVRYEIEEAA